MPAEKELYERIRRIQEGGAQKYHEANEKKGKLFVRDRLKLLLDEGLDLEDAFLPIAWQTGFRQTESSRESEKSAAEPFASWLMIQR